MVQTNNGKTDKAQPAQTNNGNRESRRYQQKQKKGWNHAVSRAMKWVFRTLMKVAELVKEFFEHALQLLGSIFDLGVQFWTSPYTHYVASILLFLGVMTYALWQWWSMGAWAGKFFHARHLGALVGLGVGTLLNLYQLSPMLWKLDRRIAKAYVKAKINPHFEPDDEESPADRLQDWGSHAHRAMKTEAANSYATEWGIYIAYWVVALKYSIMGLASGLIALKFPEWTLGWALSKQEIMRKTLQQIQEDEEVPSNVNL